MVAQLQKWARSWWGRMLIGAFIGGLLVSWVGIDDPLWFLVGMVVGSLGLLWLGQLK